MPRVSLPRMTVGCLLIFRRRLLKKSLRRTTGMAKGWNGPADLPAALRRAAAAVRNGAAGAGQRDLPPVTRCSVLIVGGGPVGSTLALDLAWRGIDVVVAERNPRGQMPGVKCNHVSARTMEIFRRLGIARIVRNTGLPADHSNDVAFRLSATGVEFARIHIPCRRDRYTDRSGPDGWWPTPEPPHRINQIYLDPLLADQAASRPGVRYLNQLELSGFSQSADGVTAELTDLDTGERRLIECDYLVGCDGPSSTVRHLIDARLTGDALIGRTQSTYFRAPGLLERMQAEPAWSTQVMNPRRSANMFAVDGRETWLLHNYLRPDETDFAQVDSDWCIRTVLGVGRNFNTRSSPGRTGLAAGCWPTGFATVACSSAAMQRISGSRLPGMA